MWSLSEAKMSENNNAPSTLVAALSKSQGEFPEIQKNSTVTVKTKSGAVYTYKYAALGDILKAVKGTLSKNGLALVYRVIDEQDCVLIAELRHSSGEYLKSSHRLGHYNDPKDFGGAMTYYRRYLTEGLLGICAQDDIDAQGTDGPDAPSPQKRAGNGKGKPITLPDMLAKINAHAEVDGYYNAPQHLINAVGNLPDDYGLQVEYYKEAVAHAKKRRDEKAMRVEQATKPDTTPVEGEAEPLFPAEPKPDEYYT
jgi:hypothetical protein